MSEVLLKNKIAVITGASQGIGAAVAKAYAKSGAHVILIARHQRNLEAIDDEIETQLKMRLADAEKKAAKKLEGQYADQLKDLQGAIEEKDDALKSFREQELELRKEQRKLKEAAESLELEVARKLDEEREKIRGEAEKKLIKKIL